MLSWRVFSLGLLVLACARQGLDEQPAGVPQRHRATDGCEKAVRPEVESCSVGPNSLSACASDDQCTAGRNGRCTNVHLGGCQCVYDACVSDDECESGSACACNPFGIGNRCVKASCRLDQDCGNDGFCGPAGLNCGGAIQTYQCYGPGDECIADSDCASGNCYGEAGKPWTCHGLLICRG